MKEEVTVTYPYHHLHLRVFLDIQRYLSYGWANTLIQSLILRRYGVCITSKCVRAIRDHTPCPAACQDKCRLEKD